MGNVQGGERLDNYREAKDMSVSVLLILCRGLAYPRVHLWLVFKHVQASTQHLPGMSEDDQDLIPPPHLARFHCPHQRLLIDYYDESAIETRPHDNHLTRASRCIDNKYAVLHLGKLLVRQEVGGFLRQGTM